jgi:hypothetical protein
VETFKGAHFKAWNAKRDHGINVHAMIATGVAPTEKEAPYVDQYLKWIADTGAEIIEHEYEVVFPEVGYGGKVDFMATIDGVPTLVDIKVRDDLRVFPDRLIQVAAYASAPIGHPMTPVRAAVLTIGHDGYSFDEVHDIEAALEAFKGLRAYFGWLEEAENA